jgi:Protein of unknown function (DUF1559)
MRVREAAARSKCSNNLKQLAFAAMNYSTTLPEKLPSLVDQGPNSRTGHGILSAFALLVPFIESGPCFYNPDLSPPSDYYAHSSAVFTHRCFDGSTFSDTGGMANRAWEMFACPADVTADTLRDVRMTVPGGATGYYATGSYAASGMVSWGTGNIPKSFTDGTATTILFAERPKVCRTAAGDTVYNLWGLGFYSPHMPAFATLTPDEPAGLQSTGQVAPVEPLPPQSHADRLRVRVGRQSAEPQPPDFATPLQFVRGGGPCDPRLPASPHFGVMQAAMADGSVHVFSLTVSPWVFWATCTPDGREDLPADW